MSGDFVSDYCSLSTLTPSIHSNDTRFSDNAMAGNEIADGVAANRVADGSTGVRLPEGHGNLFISSQLTSGYRKQRSPHPDLELTPLNKTAQ